MRGRFATSQVGGALASVYLEAGRVGDAMTSAWRALDEAIAQRERPSEGAILSLLGELHSRSDPPDLDQAERSYREALASAEELGLRPLAAHCHLGLAALHRSADRPEQAHAELDVAIEMFRAMDMPAWLARAEAERANQ